MNNLIKNNNIDTPPGSLIDSKCEFEVKITEEQGVEACSLAHNTLRGRGVCWSFRMGLGRMTST